MAVRVLFDAILQREELRADGPSVYVTLDPVAGTYSRCDRARCDHFTARANDSGRHVDIQIPSVGAIAKMTRDGSVLTEIVTAGNDVYLSFGTCRPM
jgi:hypothetical protein